MSRPGDAAPSGGPFVEAYIAPDMHMRPLAKTIGDLERAGFEIRDVEGMREHYVRTAAAWIDTFESRYDEVVRLVGEEIARVWRLYLVGGSVSFEEGRMGRRPDRRRSAHDVGRKRDARRPTVGDYRRIMNADRLPAR
jgi:cyclopropane-fatty-acyl-phospholipid synthase